MPSINDYPKMKYHTNGSVTTVYSAEVEARLSSDWGDKPVPVAKVETLEAAAFECENCVELRTAFDASWAELKAANDSLKAQLAALTADPPSPEPVVSAELAGNDDAVPVVVPVVEVEPVVVPEPVVIPEPPKNELIGGKPKKAK